MAGGCQKLLAVPVTTIIRQRNRKFSDTAKPITAPAPARTAAIRNRIFLPVRSTAAPLKMFAPKAVT